MPNSTCVVVAGNANGVGAAIDIISDAGDEDDSSNSGVIEYYCFITYALHQSAN